MRQKRLNDKMDYGLKKMNDGLRFKKMNDMDYGLKEINDTIRKVEVMRG